MMAFVDYIYSLPKSITSLAGTFFMVTISIIFAILTITSPAFYGGTTITFPVSLSSLGTAKLIKYITT